MRNFWDLNYGEAGFEFYGVYHFTCVLLIIFFGILFYKPWKKSKTFRKILAVTPITLEILRLIAVLLTGHYDSSYLPFHLCLFGAEFIAVDAFINKRFIKSCLFFLFMPAAFLSLFTPGWTEVNKLSYVAISSWIIHGINTFYPLYIVISKEYVPKFKEILYPLIFLIGILPVIKFLNKVFDANYFYIRDPYPGSFLEIIKNVFPNYIMGLYLVTFLVMIMVFLIYKSVIKVKNKKN